MPKSRSASRTAQPPDETPSPAVDKRALIQLIVAEISRDLHTLLTAAKASHAEASHEQNKPENKYDTRALEASYLARGQSRKVADLENAKQEYESLTLLEFPAQGAIDVGALIALEHDHHESVYFIGPKAGGIEIVHAGRTVTVITPNSPIGQQLMGKKAGESIALPGRQFRIVRVG